MLEDNGIDTAQAFYLTADGISHEARHKIINARAVQRLLTVDCKSVQFVAATERQWKLLFSYVPPVIPCEIIISFYVKTSPYAKQLKVDSAAFSSEPIFIAPREQKKSTNPKDKAFCTRFDSWEYNILASPSLLPSLKHCTKYPSDHVFDVSILIRPASIKKNPTSNHSHPPAASSGIEEHSPSKGLGHHRVHPVSTDRDSAATEKVGGTDPTHGIFLGKKGIMPLEMLTIPSLFVPTSVTPEWSPDKFVWQELYTFRVEPTTVHPFAAKCMEDEKSRIRHSAQLKKVQKRLERDLATGEISNPPPGVIGTPNDVVPAPATSSPGRRSPGQRSPGQRHRKSIKPHTGAHTRSVLVQPTEETANNTAAPAADTAIEMASIDASQKAVESEHRTKERRRESRVRGHYGSGRQGYQMLPNPQDGVDSSPGNNHQTSTLPVSLQAHRPQQSRSGGKSTNSSSTPTVFSQPAQLFPVLPMVLQFQKVDVSETVYSVMDVYGQRRRIATLPLVKDITALENTHWVNAASRKSNRVEKGKTIEPKDSHKESSSSSKDKETNDTDQQQALVGAGSVVSDSVASNENNGFHKPKQVAVEPIDAVDNSSVKPSSEKSSSSDEGEDENKQISVRPANNTGISTNPAAASSPDDQNTGPKKEDEEDLQCIVCLSETRDVVLFPCRHMNTCLSCAKMLIASRNQCPVCRCTAEAIVHIVAFHQEAESAANEAK
jgi:hypothetical protein